MHWGSRGPSESSAKVPMQLHPIVLALHRLKLGSVQCNGMEYCIAQAEVRLGAASCGEDQACKLIGLLQAHPHGEIGPIRACKRG